MQDAPTPAAPTQRWVSDTTYLTTRQGRVYLSLVTDAYSRRIVGHYVHPSLHTAGCLAALAHAMNGTTGVAAGAIQHADCGSQVNYTGADQVGKASMRRP